MDLPPGFFNPDIEVTVRTQNTNYRYLLYLHHRKKGGQKLVWCTSKVFEDDQPVLQELIHYSLGRTNFEEMPLNKKERQDIIALGTPLDRNFVSIFAITYDYQVDHHMVRKYVYVLNKLSLSYSFEAMLDFPLLVCGPNFLHDPKDPQNPVPWLRYEDERHFVLFLSTFTSKDGSKLGFVKASLQFILEREKYYRLLKCSGIDVTNTQEQINLGEEDGYAPATQTFIRRILVGEDMIELHKAVENINHSFAFVKTEESKAVTMGSISIKSEPNGDQTSLIKAFTHKSTNTDSYEIINTKIKEEYENNDGIIFDNDYVRNVHLDHNYCDKSRVKDIVISDVQTVNDIDVKPELANLPVDSSHEIEHYLQEIARLKAEVQRLKRDNENCSELKNVFLPVINLYSFKR